MLSISIEFLTGRYTATNLKQDKKPEWPPHPGRLFMAMVSAYFDGGEKQNEKKALEWLEQCSPPWIYYEPDKITKRDIVETYVPINDEIGKKVKKGGALLTTLEIPLNRIRKSRMFPTTITGYDPVYFVWDDADSQKYSNTLKTLCSRVHRLGHSSSFVSLTVNDSKVSIDPAMIPDKFGDTTVRWASKGLLSKLEKSFMVKDILKSHDEYFIRKARLNAISLPEYRYSKKQDQKAPCIRGQFSDMWIMPITSDQKPSLLHSKHVIRSLRNKIQESNSPEYISGLDTDGNPSKKPHIAIVPLSFTGHSYADGLIRGVAIIFPRERDSKSEDVISKALFGTKESTEIRIKNKNYDDIVFSLDPPDHPIRTLDPNTWKESARTWVTTTPIILDRIPRVKDSTTWNDKAGEIISKSCTYQNLPEPDVSISNIAFLKGVPKSNTFPKYAENRIQVHARLQFKEKITGPLLLGAGRYNGYGLCRPWWDKQWLN